MSHVIAEEKMRIGARTYYLHISHSGGATYAKIYYFKDDIMHVSLSEEGKDAENNARHYWNSMKSMALRKGQAVERDF